MHIVARVTAVSLCVLLALTMAGCNRTKAKPDLRATVAADTNTQGSITVYTSLPQATADSYLAIFKRDYPKVQVTVVRDTSAAIADKIVKEKDAPVADVIWHTPVSAVYKAVEASAIAGYAYHPGQLDAVSADYSDPDNSIPPLLIGTDARMIAFAVNGGKTGGSTPLTFSNLADPKYSGQIVMPSINTDAGYALVSAMLLNKGDEQDAWDLLDSIDKNVTYYSDDQTVPVKDVANGAAGVGVGWDGDVVKAQNDGNSVKAVFPGQPEMSPWTFDADALVKKPQPSAAAKVFLDWAISDEAMAVYSKDTPVTSVDSGAGLPSGYPSSVTDQLMQPVDWSSPADNHDKIVAEWMKRYGKKIKAQ